MCTYSPAQYAIVVPECLINMSDINTTACKELRNISDQDCARTTCIALFINDLFGSYPPQPNLTYYPIAVASEDLTLFFVTLLGNVDGPVYMMQMIAQFVTNNLPVSEDPIVPVPRPFNESLTFLPTDLGSLSFQTIAREFARQQAIMFLNYFMNYYSTLVPDALQPDVLAALFNLNYTPLRCPDANLAAIAWVTVDNAVNPGDAVYTANYMLAFNTTISLLDPENWPSTCTDYFGWTIFCAQFPDYYSFESLRNFSIVPSPYADLTTLLTVFNNEYTNCDVPRGCLGVAV